MRVSGGVGLPVMSEDILPAEGGPIRLRRLREGAGAALFGLLDLALPPGCLACDQPVGIHGGLCAGCWGRFRLIERPYCARLGIPFAYDIGAGALSPEAIADPPPFARCRAVAHFDEVARRLVHGLKYRDRIELARWLGTWMARAGADLLGDADIVVPVPLHRARLWRRRFNQSAVLAQVIAAAGGKECAPGVLHRVRATAQQVGMNAAERDKNVRGAFAVPPPQRGTVAGRRVLLVDDVYTTGATVKAATRALTRAGAMAVDVLVFARVVRGAD